MPALRGGERGLWEQSPWVGQDVWREWPQRRPGGWRAGEIPGGETLALHLSPEPTASLGEEGQGSEERGGGG